MKKKLLIGLGVVVLIIIVLMATGALKFKVGGRPSQPQDAVSTESVLPEGWVKYTSGEFGYSVAYPSDWSVKETNEGSREVLLIAPKDKAFIRIAGMKDESVDSVATVEASMVAYKASFESKQNEELKEFKSEMQGEIGGFFASGRMKVNETIYQFLEKGLLATNGRVLIVRGAVDTSETGMTQAEFDTQVKTVKQIMDSFWVK